MYATKTLLIVASCALGCAACRKQNSSHESGTETSAPAKREGLLAEGAAAPDISFEVHNGQTLRLAELRGKPVVVYFYPKDDTPGCTIEAQEIRDLWSDIQKTNAVVIGVSSDGDASHREFASKYQLPFLLAADEDHKLAEAFGVPLTLGKAKRVTFVIDRRGKVRKVFPAVTPKGHGAEVLSTLQGVAAG